MSTVNLFESIKNKNYCKILLVSQLIKFIVQKKINNLTKKDLSEFTILTVLAKRVWS